MGIGRHVVEALIRENLHRPIDGNVVLIGRQTIYFAPESILALFEELGADVAGIRPADIRTGGSSTNNLPSFDGQELITDAELFRMLGVPKILALDHSDYEGAEIIHDLTKPIPSNLEGCADFILDGSTLDNVFDPAMVIRNFATMLRPGGRLVTTNMYSNHYEPYAILPPLWFLDYFVTNGFNDCKVYILVINLENSQNSYSTPKSTSVFTIDIDALLDPTKIVSAFSSPSMMATIVFAEKGVNSTSDLMPSQQHYRSASAWEAYRHNLRLMKTSARPHLVRTTGDIDFFDVKGGHLFIAEDFSDRDPSTEIHDLEQRKLAALPSYLAGALAYSRQDYEAALALWRPLAERGDAEAAAGLGLLFANGEGVPADDTLAARWFLAAAERGNKDAQRAMSQFFAAGRGVARDDAAARRWLHAADAAGPPAPIKAAGT